MVKSAHIRLWDAHVHLQDPAWAPDLDAVLARATAAGVVGFINNGTREDDWPRVLALAQARPDIVPCFGLHPWFVSQKTAAWLSCLEQMLVSWPSGVGEIGLDRWIRPRDESDQENVFGMQLRVASKYGRPAMIHCVRAWDRLSRVLAEEGPFPAGLLIHAFGGSVELGKSLVQMGAYLSFAGNVLDPRRHRQQEVLRQVPTGRLLLETVSHRGIPVISSMGAALRQDPGSIRVGPLAQVKNCRLARYVRRGLRRRGLELGFPCIYSIEPEAVPPRSDDLPPIGHDEETLSRGRARQPLGSLPTLTGIFGLIAANCAIQMILSNPARRPTAWDANSEDGDR
jgi:TatD DNase family protein